MKRLNLRCDGTIFLSEDAATIVVGNGYAYEGRARPTFMDEFYFFGLSHVVPISSIPRWLLDVCKSPAGRMGTGLVPFVGTAVMREESDQVGLWINRGETMVLNLTKGVPVWRRTADGNFIPSWGATSLQDSDSRGNRALDRMRELEGERLDVSTVPGWAVTKTNGDPDLVLPKKKFGRKIS